MQRFTFLLLFWLLVHTIHAQTSGVSQAIYDQTTLELSTTMTASVVVGDSSETFKLNHTATPETVVNADELTTAPTPLVDSKKYLLVQGISDRYFSTQLNGLQLPTANPDYNTTPLSVTFDRHEAATYGNRQRTNSPLDLIPAHLLDNILVTKFFTPDLPGHSTNGNLQLTTRAFPNKLTLGVNITTSFNLQSSFQSDFLTHAGGKFAGLGYDDGTRALPRILQSAAYNDVTAGSHIAARRDADLAYLLDEGARSIQSQHQPDTKTAGSDQAASFFVGNSYQWGKNSLGISLGLNYRKSYQHYNNGTFRYWDLTDPNAGLSINRNLTETRSVETPQLGGMLNVAYQVGTKNKFSFSTLYDHLAQNDNRILTGTFPAIILDTDNFTSRSLRFSERRFVNHQLSGTHLIGADKLKIEWAGSRVTTSQNLPDFRQFSTAETNTSFNRFASPLRFWRTLDDVQYTGKVDITIPLGADARNNKLQLGAFYSNKNRTFVDDVFEMAQGDGAAYTGDPEAYFGNNNIGIIDSTDNPKRYQIGLFPYRNQTVTAEHSYDGTENIGAAYALLVHHWDWVKLMAGARIESTNINVQSRATTLAAGAVEQIDVLPSLQLVFPLNDSTNIQVSATQTLARPSMRELSPFVSFDFAGDFRLQGNPNLERTLVQNLDVRWAAFRQSGAVIAVNAFYKNFDRPIVTTLATESSSPQLSYTNLDRAQVYGLEVEWRKNLRFMGTAFAPFNFSANAAVLRSMTDMPPSAAAIINELNPDQGTTRPLSGQSPFLLNAVLDYVNIENGWEAMIAFQVFGERLLHLSQGVLLDIYEQPRPQLDFSVRKSFSKNFSIRLHANNLLNPNHTTLMRFNGEDYLIRDFQRGTSFGLSLAYNI